MTPRRGVPHRFMISFSLSFTDIKVLKDQSLFLQFVTVSTGVNSREAHSLGCHSRYTFSAELIY